MARQSWRPNLFWAQVKNKRQQFVLKKIINKIYIAWTHGWIEYYWLLKLEQNLVALVNGLKMILFLQREYCMLDFSNDYSYCS